MTGSLPQPRDLAEQLRAARDLIADPTRWTQGSFARDADGDPCGSRHPAACQWCLEGALVKVGARFAAETYLYRALPKGEDDAAHYNDNRQHRTIIRLLDKAIALAEQEATSS